MQQLVRKPAEAPPPRMGPLATLPVFLNLAGKRVVIVGGSAAAAWKLELVAASGATVELFASDLDREMERVLAGAWYDSAIHHHARSWSLADLTGAALAIADIDDEAEAKAFACAARSQGVPVNVIDKPAYCQFQFGSIVNRSPVVVGISTAGAAPILAQAIRQRVEALLPAALASWGALAARVRRRVMERLPKGPLRRRFWEAFAERALRDPFTRRGEQDLELLLSGAAEGANSTLDGHVSLVGAGPGDAELLTVKAVRALQSADVILYDDLVSDDVLELARREARRVKVGKRGRRDSCAQDDINSLMIGLARLGKRVVRLKSGDPMIFGRAGEEIAELEAAGIPVDVVPGVTAALAAAARLGVSLTHRDCAQSVRFVTGHARSGELPDLDWAGLADSQSTLVFYMGGRTASAIAGRLLASGLAATTPVTVLAGLSRPDEQCWRGCLSELVSGFPDFEPDLPILIGIGTVFAQRSGRPEGRAGRSGDLIDQLPHVLNGLEVVDELDQPFGAGRRDGNAGRCGVAPELGQMRLT